MIPWKWMNWRLPEYFGRKSTFFPIFFFDFWPRNSRSRHSNIKKWSFQNWLKWTFFNFLQNMQKNHGWKWTVSRNTYIIVIIFETRWSLLPESRGTLIFENERFWNKSGRSSIVENIRSSFSKLKNRKLMKMDAPELMKVDVSKKVDVLQFSKVEILQV